MSESGRSAELSKSSAQGVRSPILLAALVAVAGSGTMIVELSAVRLLAPWFGASSAVWTNVIGVVLCALALGYLLGARFSAGADPERSLGFVLAGGSVSTLLLPLAAPLVSRFFLGDPELSLDHSTSLFAWGSLAASLILFTPAALFLGCVGPLAVELLQRSGVAHAGTAGGRVLFASTVGSLAGTFATTHLFLPELGLRKTFLLAGLLLGSCAAIVLLVRRRSLSAPAALALPMVAMLAAGTAAASVPFAWPEPSGGEVLARAESPYQSLTVVERVGASAQEGPMRLLQVNEGLDSYQSVWTKTPGLLPLGYYYNYFAPPLAFRGEDLSRREEDPRSLRVAVLGFGAGTAWRVLDGVFGATDFPPEMTGIEIDPFVIAMGERWFELPPDHPRLTVLSGRDGRAALRELAPGLDLVLLDAYANQTEIPAHLSTVEFFSEVASKLTPGGYLAANVGGFGLHDPVVEGLAFTMAAAFETPVLALAVPYSRNVALWCVRSGGEGLPLPESTTWKSVTGEVAGLLDAVSLPGTWRVFAPRAEGAVATDDRNPMERLQRESLARGFPLGEERRP